MVARPGRPAGHRAPGAEPVGTLSKAVFMVKAGLHWSFNISKQIAPCWGTDVGVPHFRKLHFGGSKG